MEGAAADAGDLGNVGWRVDRQSPAAARRAGKTIRAAGIADGIHPGHALRVCLARPGLHGEHVGAQREGFAEAVADTEYRGEILVDGVLHGVHYVIGVHIEQGRLRRRGAGPLKIEIGFAEIAFHGTGILSVGHQKQLGVGGRKLKLRAKGLDVGESDPGLAGNDDFLPGSVEAGVPKGFDVVDGAVVVGAQVVIAGSGGGVAGIEHGAEDGLGLHAEIVQAVDGADRGLKGGGE